MQTMQEIITGKNNGIPDDTLTHIFLSLPDEDAFALTVSNKDAWHYQYARLILRLNHQQEFAKIELILTNVYLHLSFFSDATIEAFPRWQRCLTEILHNSRISIIGRAVTYVILIECMQQHEKHPDFKTSPDFSKNKIRIHQEFGILLQLLDIVNPQIANAIEAHFAQLTEQRSQAQRCVRKYQGPTTETNVLLLKPFIQTQSQLTAHLTYYANNLKHQTTHALYHLLKIAPQNKVDLSSLNIISLLEYGKNSHLKKVATIIATVLTQIRQEERIVELRNLRSGISLLNRNFTNSIKEVATLSIALYLEEARLPSGEMFEILKTIPYSILKIGKVETKYTLCTSKVFIAGFSQAISHLSNEDVLKYSVALFSYLTTTLKLKNQEVQALWAQSFGKIFSVLSSEIKTTLIDTLLNLHHQHHPIEVDVENDEFIYYNNLRQLSVLVSELITSLPEAMQHRVLIKNIFRLLSEDNIYKRLFSMQVLAQLISPSTNISIYESDNIFNWEIICNPNKVTQFIISKPLLCNQLLDVMNESFSQKLSDAEKEIVTRGIVAILSEKKSDKETLQFMQTLLEAHKTLALSKEKFYPSLEYFDALALNEFYYLKSHISTIVRLLARIVDRTYIPKDLLDVLLKQVTKNHKQNILLSLSTVHLILMEPKEIQENRLLFWAQMTESIIQFFNNVDKKVYKDKSKRLLISILRENLNIFGFLVKFKKIPSDTFSTLMDMLSKSTKKDLRELAEDLEDRFYKNKIAETKQYTLQEIMEIEFKRYDGEKLISCVFNLNNNDLSQGMGLIFNFIQSNYVYNSDSLLETAFHNMPSDALKIEFLERTFEHAMMDKQNDFIIPFLKLIKPAFEYFQSQQTRLSLMDKVALFFHEFPEEIIHHAIASISVANNFLLAKKFDAIYPLFDSENLAIRIAACSLLSRCLSYLPITSLKKLYTEETLALPWLAKHVSSANCSYRLFSHNENATDNKSEPALENSADAKYTG